MSSTLIRLAALVAVAAICAAAGYLSRGGGSAPVSERTPPAAPPETARGVVQSVTDSSITLLTSGGSRSVALSGATVFEALRPASLSDIREGDWVNGGGVMHPDTRYALTGLIIIPPANLGTKR